MQVDSDIHVNKKNNKYRFKHTCVKGILNMIIKGRFGHCFGTSKTKMVVIEKTFLLVFFVLKV